jgi:hypothetical protein
MRLFKIIPLLTIPALLSGCLLTPGAFESDLRLGKNGLFTYRYKGEMVIATPDVMFDSMLGLGRPNPVFNPDHTYCEGPVPRGQKVTDKRPIPVEDQMADAAVEEMLDAGEDESKVEEKSEIPSDAAAPEEKKSYPKDVSDSDVDAAAKAAEAVGDAAKAKTSNAADAQKKAGEDAETAVDKAVKAVKVAEEKTEILNDDGEIIQRRCTTREMAKKKRAHDLEIAEAKQRAAEQKAEYGRQIKAEFGYDPSSEAEMARFAKDMRKEPGWKSIAYKGKGVYTVDYNYTGPLDRDFVFPVFPESKLITPFVMIRKRNDGSALVTAPAFARATANNIMNRTSSVMSLASAFMNKDFVPNTAGIKGRFSISTDGAILTNNTVDGPEGAPGDQTLAWSIFAAEDRIPETLIKLTDGGAK